MIIETKYNVGDRLWYMENNKACSRVVAAIKFTCYGDIVVKDYGYYLEPESGDESIYWFEQHESHLYPSKEELLNSL